MIIFLSFDEHRFPSSAQFSWKAWVKRWFSSLVPSLSPLEHYSKACWWSISFSRSIAVVTLTTVPCEQSLRTTYTHGFICTKEDGSVMKNRNYGRGINDARDFRNDERAKRTYTKSANPWRMFQWHVREVFNRVHFDSSEPPLRNVRASLLRSRDPEESSANFLLRQVSFKLLLFLEHL